VIALAVLVGAAGVLVYAGRLSRRDAGEGEEVGEVAPGPGAGEDIGARDSELPPDQQDMVAFLVALGEAMIDSGDPVTHVQDTLQRVADANHVSAAGIVVLPTALIVSLPGERAVETSVTVAGTSRLRLDQIDEVFLVATDAEHGRVGPVEGLSRLHTARTRQAPFSTPLIVAGQVVLTVGLALILQADAADLAVSALLGAAVGAAQIAGRRLTSAYQVFVPVLSAFGVAVIVFLLPRTGLDTGIMAPLIAPLVMFLPGALLTTSVIELATGQMISGASRLAAGAMQLTLLAFGVVAGAQLVGIPAASVLTMSSEPLSDLAPWIGVALFGGGVVVHQCARRESSGWILLVLYVAYAGQVLGGFLLGGVLSAFVGALLMTPVAVYVATLRSGPATLVSFLPAFWLLVPGALGLVGVTQLFGADRGSGLNSLLTTGATMIGIAFGVLLGLAATTGITTLAGVASWAWRPEVQRH
jgi:uncharacterized membrane protein YjjP (DUF1212 family)